MKLNRINPLLIGFGIALFLLALCLVVNIPMYDGEAVYKQELVHFVGEGKISLRNLLGKDLNKLEMQGLTPFEVQLKPIGYLIFAIIHLGLPALIFLRFHFASLKNQTENEQ